MIMGGNHTVLHQPRARVYTILIMQWCGEPEPTVDCHCLFGLPASSSLVPRDPGGSGLLDLGVIEAGNELGGWREISRILPRATELAS